MQQTANQLGGVIGTSVLGTIIVAGVGSHLVGRLSAAHVPQGTIAQLNTTAVKQAISQGIAPVTAQTPHALVAPITAAAKLTFLDGLHSALIVGAIVAFAGALAQQRQQRGHEVEGPAGAVYPRLTPSDAV